MQLQLQKKYHDVWLIALTASAIFVALLVANYFVERQHLVTQRVDAENQVHEQLRVLQTRLESQLNGNIQLARGLVAVIAANPQLSQEEFKRAAKPLFEGRSLLRNIAAAPDMVIRLMYPMAGNEKAVGLDYSKVETQREAAELARDTGKLVLAGPLNLVQGGRGVIARIPVYLDQKEAHHRFWGLLSVVIDVDRLYKESGLLDDTLQIEIALRGKDGTGNEGDVFYGDPTLFSEQAVTLPVTLPYGFWQIAAKPRGGWDKEQSGLFAIRSGFALALLLSVGPMLLLAYYAFRRNQAELELAAHREHLESMVKVRTAELSSAKDAAEAANDELTLFKRFAEESVQGSGMATMERKVFFFNKRLLKLLGLTQEEARVNKYDFTTFYSQSNKEKIIQEVIPAITERGYWTGELALVNQVTSEITPTLESWFLIKDQDDKPLCFMGLMTDISKQKKVETALTQAKEAAESANTAKGAFLANMSHEIRTPLTTVVGMAHLIRRDGLNPLQTERMDKLDVASEHLLEIIETILDLSKIEAGKFNLKEDEIRVSKILDGVAAMVRTQAESKNLQFKVHCSNIPSVVLGDPTRLRQALLNYAGNAVKFTDHGNIILRAWVENEMDQDILVRFEVQDTGIGIPEKDIPRLFSAFEQADNSLRREYGGTGLGLAITQKIAQLMGGSAGVDTQPGKGSTFWFTARLKKTAVKSDPAYTLDNTDAEEILRSDYKDARVLIVDDEPINRVMFGEFLEIVELKAEQAQDGQQAVEAVEKKTYDLILMDMQMPRLDGLAATQKIRELPNGATIPILALTGNAFADDEQKCFEAGMDGFISKPINTKEFYSTLLKLLAKKTNAH